MLDFDPLSSVSQVKHIETWVASWGIRHFETTLGSFETFSNGQRCLQPKTISDMLSTWNSGNFWKCRIPLRLHRKFDDVGWTTYWSTGWWLSPTPPKSWEYEIPNWMENKCSKPQNRLLTILNYYHRGLFQMIIYHIMIVWLSTMYTLLNYWFPVEYDWVELSKLQKMMRRISSHQLNLQKFTFWE